MVDPSPLVDLMPRLGWWARRAARRLVAQPQVSRMAALVAGVRRVRDAGLLAEVGAALAAAYPQLFVRHCVPELDAGAVEALALRRDTLALRLGAAAGVVDVVLRSAEAEVTFRGLPKVVRRRFGEVTPFDRGEDMRCPVCDAGDLRRSKSTATGREIREYYCHECRWLFHEDRGLSLSEMLYGGRTVQREERASEAPLSGQEARVHLIVTDVMGYYDDALGVYCPSTDPAWQNTSDYWFRVPIEWLVDGAVPAARLGALHAHIYGEDWLYSRERSKYLVLASEARTLDAGETATAPWLAGRRVYVPAGAGFREAKPEEF